MPLFFQRVFFWMKKSSTNRLLRAFLIVFFPAIPFLIGRLSPTFKQNLFHLCRRISPSIKKRERHGSRFFMIRFSAKQTVQWPALCFPAC